MPEIFPNLHPFAVHFPIALIGVSVIFHFFAMLFRHHAWSSPLAAAGHWAFWVGAFAATVAALTGWFASNSVNHDEAGHVAMLLHRSWALATLAAAIFLAGWDIWRSKGDRIMPLWFLLPLGLVGAMVMTTGWLGSELVYRHGLGVIALPQATSEEHNGVHNHSQVSSLSADESSKPDEMQPTEHQHDMGVMEQPQAASEKGQEHNGVHDHPQASPPSADKSRQAGEKQSTVRHQHVHVHHHHQHAH